MTSLVRKRDSLLNSISKLDSFALDNEDLNTTLTISDGKTYNSNGFTTTNSVVIDGVAEFLKKIIFEKIEEIEKNISLLI